MAEPTKYNAPITDEERVDMSQLAQMLQRLDKRLERLELDSSARASTSKEKGKIDSEVDEVQGPKYQPQRL